MGRCVGRRVIGEVCEKKGVGVCVCVLGSMLCVRKRLEIVHLLTCVVGVTLWYRVRYMRSGFIALCV